MTAKKRPASVGALPGTVQLIHLEGKAMNEKKLTIECAASATDLHPADVKVQKLADAHSLAELVEGLAVELGNHAGLSPAAAPIAHRIEALGRAIATGILAAVEIGADRVPVDEARR